MIDVKSMRQIDKLHTNNWIYLINFGLNHFTTYMNRRLGGKILVSLYLCHLWTKYLYITWTVNGRLQN